MKDRATYEIRDVHTSHYGRICPIATPEGPNIGLVGHLASYAVINKYGFIETPYRKVEKIKGKDGKTRVRATDEIEYINAFKEDKHVTVPATVNMDHEGYLLDAFVSARKFGEPQIVSVEEVDYVDVSSKQIVSIGTSLIPFLEHDDATRALMGTNMQRQAVPTIKAQSPIVGTGAERRAARDSGHVVLAAEEGKITAVDGIRVEITDKKNNVYVQNLNKFLRSNASTCINQVPVVNVGDKVKKGDPIADSSAVEKGELALGQNALVAFMVWEGYNYEDAVILSEKVVADDRYSSIHIEHYPIDVRETKLGPELITSDIPNISEEKLKNLDEEGIIRRHES